jgi:two-component system, chemotaxis family, protein-glutamate methylesterase/glutaminase
MSAKKIQILVVDDSAVVRRLLTTIITEDPELEVMAVAQNGKVALKLLESIEPDLITLDIEMPEMDGLEALLEIRKKFRRLPVIMFSTITERGASATLEALARGASDYVCKPANVGSVTAAMDAVRTQLIPKIKAFCRPTAPVAPVMARATSQVTGLAPTRAAKVARTNQVDVVVIGASTGGPTALASVVNVFPADFPVPVVITQHMPPVFTRYLSQRLNGSSPIEVREAQDGDVLRPGLVLIAPGDYHMTFRAVDGGTVVVLDQGPQVNFCRPSVDVMMASIAKTFQGRVLSVVLTGMGSDGRDGCATLRDLGAEVIAQDQATSVVWGMPGAVVTSGLADQVLPLDDIGAAIVQRATRRLAGLRSGT